MYTEFLREENSGGFACKIRGVQGEFR